MYRSERTHARHVRLEGVGRLAALLVALAGLFAMHGMADHGSAAHAAVPSMSTSSAADTDHAAHTGLAMSDGQQADSSAPIGDDEHGGMGLLGVCLAVLAAVLSLFAGVLLSRRSVALAALLPAVRQLAVCWRRARDPVPPDLFRLSIQRC